MTPITLNLSLLKETYAVCRLNPTTVVGDWADHGEFCSITKTSEECSVVCPQDKVPDDIKAEKHWRIFKIEGPFAFTQVGILNAVTKVLAENGISLFALSTFDTDYILVKSKDLVHAIECLSQAGHTLTIR